MKATVFILNRERNNETFQRVWKDMRNRGYSEPKQFELYLSKLLDTLERFENKPESKAVGHDERVLCSLDMLYSEYKDRNARCIPMTKAYMQYMSLVEPYEECLNRKDYKNALLQLGLIVRIGGGNLMKIYNLHAIPKILDDKEYI